MLVERVAGDAELVRGKVRVGVADRQTAQNVEFLWDVQLLANDVWISRNGHLDAGSHASGGQCQQQCLQKHADAEAVGRSEVPVDTDDAGQRRAEELPVAQTRSPPAFGVLAGDAHRPVELGAELPAEVGKRLRQGWDLGWLARASASRAVTRRSRAAPVANTVCHGWMLELDGARTARSNASSTSSCGTGWWGKNIRVDRRSLITCSSSDMVRASSKLVSACD